jgi:hypothetical protein
VTVLARNVAAWVVCAAIGILSCERTNAPPRPSEATGGPAVAPTVATTTGGSCADIRARFNAAHAARTDVCKSDGDCGCFNPVGGPQLGCGGVTDAATVAKLSVIEAEFHAASCP